METTTQKECLNYEYGRDNFITVTASYIEDVCAIARMAQTNNIWTVHIEGNLFSVSFDKMVDDLSPLNGKVVKNSDGTSIPLPLEIKYGERMFYVRSSSVP